MFSLSRYTYEIDHDPSAKPGAMSLIYNSFADSLAKVPSQLFEALKLADEVTLRKYAKEIRTLKDEGFLANPAFDEKGELRQWYEQVIRQNHSLDLTILLSYRCNFACPYCFEAEFLGNVRMKQQTQDALVTWVEELLLSKDIPNLSITFFGGEPLVERETLFYLIEQFSKLCKAHGRTFEFGLITNGFHLKKELYQKLKALGLKQVKVTLDGDKEEHDKSRPLRGGRGSFEVILKNLKEIEVLTSFTLGGNFDQSDPNSIDSVFKLLDRLRREGLDSTVGKFAFKPIMNAGTEATESFVSNIGDGDMTGYLRIEKELRQRKLKSVRRVVTGPCEALMEHSMAMDPLGDLYPCGAFAGDKRACIGNVRSGYNKNYDKVMGFNAMDDPTCGECKNLPSCFGGCRWAALKQQGDYSAFQCNGEFYKKAVPDLLRMEAEEDRSANNPNIREAV